MQHGQLDKVVHRKEMKSILTKLLDMHAVKGESSMAGEMPFEKPLS